MSPRTRLHGSQDAPEPPRFPGRFKVDKIGCVTLRYLSRLHHIRVGAAHISEPVRLLVANKDIRVIREDGFLLRELTLDPTSDYQPLGTPPGRRKVVQDVARQVSAVS